MSNALAIAHVTQALALLIENNVGPEFGEAVKVEPRKPPADPQLEQPTISVFLYQVTPNTSQRNNDLPTRASDGTLVKRPAAALDLHYLISAYGDEKELVGQRLIGSVVRTLHEIPVLPKDAVELAGERPYLTGSNLAESAQRVRFTPTVMDVDETSKLWGMLYQTPYTLSVVYQATLVYIDGRQTPVAGKPVERPEVKVLPFGAPGAPVPPGLSRRTPTLQVTVRPRKSRRRSRNRPLRTRRRRRPRLRRKPWPKPPSSPRRVPGRRRPAPAGRPRGRATTARRSEAA
ncbi:DUF4255 domain-containing protein [Streptomyces chiangmaiensis]